MGTTKTTGMFDSLPGGSSSIEVQPAALDKFATDTLNNYSEAMEVVNAYAKDLSAPKFGASGLSGSVDMVGHYVGIGTQNGAYVEAMSKGTQAIAWGGRTIAANYIISDDAAQDQMSDVDAAFQAVPPAGSTTLDQAIADSNPDNDPNKDVTPANMPAPNDYVPDNYDSPVTLDPNAPCVMTPEQEVQANVNYDMNSNNGHGMVDYRANQAAPESVQIQYNSPDTTQPDYVQVVDDQGNTSYKQTSYWTPTSGLSDVNYSGR